MKLTVLTSSRADYGIYLPLLKAVQRDPFFDLRLIAFGTHLSKKHGFTIDVIEKDGFTIDYKIDHVPSSDTPEGIASSMAEAVRKFIPIWEKEKNSYDLVLCLGDRYEMFAAVSIAAPFEIPFAHLHGGETTLGAIDNEFRHCITVFSQLHFVSAQGYGERVAAIKGDDSNIYVVGALSLDNLDSIELLSEAEFKKLFGIDMTKPSLLITYHPETVASDKNRAYAENLVNALASFNDYQLIVTMPNADTMGDTMREVYERFAQKHRNVVLVENFGTQGYFSCMKYAALVAGNSSSGIIEAASLGKHVVNIGDRQKGRLTSDNVISSPHDTGSIIEAIRQGVKKGSYSGNNIYYKGKVADAIITAIKTWKG
jgi:GDP/UDP-N,N'-diacetylbacillosamine 2-epimerase (hydrolysing)